MNIGIDIGGSHLASFSKKDKIIAKIEVQIKEKDKKI